MIRKRVLLKSIAVFLILETLFNTVAPSISWALTAGPTAPEATSFEPVDTSSMVNFATGDLAYNLPLIEVPGPSGGYPLSLSYHAGIQPNEDASWIGLGWTLNPGAIIRNVNGFADDHKNVGNTSRTYWHGGATETYEGGVSVGIQGTPVSVSAGLSISQDTYMGTGMGFYVGVGSTIPGTGGMGSVGGKIGVAPYSGDYYASTGTSLSIPIGQAESTSASLSTGVGLSTNFKSVSGYGTAGVGAMGNEFLGTSISTGGSGINSSVSVGGVSLAQNSKAGNVSTNSNAFGVTIPTPWGFNINLAYSYNRYWINSLENVDVSGSLYYPQTTSALTKEYFDKNAFDTYSLPDQTKTKITDNKNPDKAIGGSFPSYDNYTVHAQGIFGNMRPYDFKKHLFKRNNYTEESNGSKTYQTLQFDLADHNTTGNGNRPEFRFINDFSNRFENTPTTIQDKENDLMEYNFSMDSQTKIDKEGTVAYASNVVQGSKDIVWLTNQEIMSHANRMIQSGFIEPKASGFDRSSQSGDLIGGFVIVNESGNRYHFALPALSYNEYLYTGNKNDPSAFNEFRKPEAYAYTWYLTAITGPDFVDRGINGTADGILNEYDWGYWVEFEYGKWTGQYAWRNPSEGMATDLDENFENFSEGLKELYYLDAIRTKTHTALFFKDIRHDGKSSINLLRRNVKKVVRRVSPGVYERTTPVDDIVEATKVGGFTPKAGSSDKEIKYFYKISVFDPNFNAWSDVEVEATDNGHVDYFKVPASTLKLDSIILIENSYLKDIPLTKSHGEQYDMQFSFPWNYTLGTALGQAPPGRNPHEFDPVGADYHLYQNVYDIHDLAAVRESLNSKALRVVKFNSDYSLCPETDNSFDYSLLKVAQPSYVATDYPKSGKLTLNSVEFLGKAGASIIPPMQFSYDLSQANKGSAVISLVSGAFTFIDSDSPLVEGDIIRFMSNSKLCFAFINKIADGTHTLKILGDNTPIVGNISWTVTKNPPYNKDAYDMWGLYKGNYSNTGHPNTDRSVSQKSSRGLDVWSLRSVQLPTGGKIDIEYESDSYRRAVLNSNYDHYLDAIGKAYVEEGPNIEHPENQYPNSRRIVLDNYTPAPFKVGQEIQLNFIYSKSSALSWQCSNYPSETNEYNLHFNGSAKITMVRAHDLIVESPELIEAFPLYEDPLVGGNCKRTWSCSVNFGVAYPLNKYGGGIRVAEVKLTDGFQTSKTTHYDYTDNGVFSGVTSYEPNFINAESYYTPDVAYLKMLNEAFHLVSFSREIPPPGVMYEYVTVRESVTKEEEENMIPNYTTYQFEVFNNGMVGVKYEADDAGGFFARTYNGYFTFNRKETRNVVLKDYTARVGSLKAITLYDGSNQILSETKNHFFHDQIQPASPGTNNDPALDDDFESNIEVFEPLFDTKFTNQGVIEETFTDARFIRPVTGAFVLQGVITKREQFPSVQIGQTTKDFKTGITTTSSNLAFDYRSGQLTRSEAVDAYGNIFVTETTPAYKRYEAMGPSSQGGRNMLIQQASSYTYKIDHTRAKVGLASASVQTWSNQIRAVAPGQYSSQATTQQGVWRKSASYVFTGNPETEMTGDGLYPLSNSLPEFEAWGDEEIPINWKRTGRITLYDVNSHALAGTDINKDYSATLMSNDQSVLLATAINANYDEFAYTGSEEQAQNGFYGGMIAIGGGLNDETKTHTGKASLKLNSQKSGYLISLSTSSARKKFRVSAWIHQSNAGNARFFYQFFNTGLNQDTDPNPVYIPFIPNEQKKSGEWYLFEADIPVPTPSNNQLKNYVLNGGWNNNQSASVWIDDFRIHPFESSISSCVYNSWGELSHILDNNNMYTEYEYDNIGRLKSVHRETFKYEKVQLSLTEYNYAQH